MKRFFLYDLCLLFAFAFLFCTLVLSSCNSHAEFPKEQYDVAYYEFLTSKDEARYKTASDAFLLLAKKYPRFPEIWYNYALCEAELKSYKKSISALEKTVKLSKNTVLYEKPSGIKNDALTSILEVYLLSGDLKRAENQAERCFAEDNSRNMQIAIFATYVRLGFSNEVKAFLARHNISEEDLFGKE